MANRRKRARRMIWALDPYSQERTALTQTAEVIRNFIADETWEIEPTYILSPVGLNWSGEFTPPWPSEYKELAEGALASLLKEVHLPEALPPKILVNSSHSLRKDAGLLLNYAKKNRADGITLNTHSRKGIVRLFLGSFTHEMLLRTETPLLIVNPHLQNVAPIRTILCPTDLSRASKTILKQIAEIAKAKNSKVTLFYKVVDAINPFIQSGVVISGGGWVTVDHLLRDEYKKSQELLNRWAQELKKLGVETDTKVVKSPLSIAEEILNYAKTIRPQLICMNSRVGPVTSFLVGSVAREIIMQAESPVWVVHN